MEKVDLKEKEITSEAVEEPEKPQKRILPPSRIKYKNNHWTVDKNPKDEVVEFSLDEETTEPFKK